MTGTETVLRIRAEHIESVLNEGDKLVLLACIRNGTDLRKTLQTLDSVAVFSGPSLRVCYAMEDLLPYLEKRFGVTGTPAHILIQNGRLQDSLLGKTSIQTLMTFVGQYIQSAPPMGDTPESGESGAPPKDGLQVQELPAASPREKRRQRIA